MSYILEALNKAETTRKQENLSELPSGLYRPSTVSAPHRWLKRALFLLTLLLCFILGYVARPYIDNMQISFSKPESQVLTVIDPTAEPPKVALPKIVSSDARVETVLQDLRLSAQEKLEPASTEPLLSVISYSADSTERFAMINNIILYEGDVLSSGEQLVQIDKNSVLLEKEGESFVLTVN